MRGILNLSLQIQEPDLELYFQQPDAVKVVADLHNALSHAYSEEYVSKVKKTIKMHE